MTESTLNLARKWRSKNFDTIVGQELVIRMLKNSLYLDHYFPVYLFSGQRGCGKTTTARVFAAAVNCEQLAVFQKQPKNQLVPCGECASCSAMALGKHPDFIEIDAASHTGVDNVRQIIEASSFLPLLGRKKIYLIDEAHMLSKAAFNAFLKILEEPPMSVLFILATTDAHKIIDTVKSRCFQLFFLPIVQQQLASHLIAVCQAEQIEFDEDAIDLIVHESEGSARDALNLLEQVRFSTVRVTKDAVLITLGSMSDESLIALLDVALHGEVAQLVTLFEETRVEQYAAEKLFARMVELIRVALWLKYGVRTAHEVVAAQLDSLVSRSSSQQLIALLESFCQAEIAFGKTNKKHIFLQMLLINMARSDGAPSVQSSVLPPKKNSFSTEQMVKVNTAITEEKKIEKVEAAPVQIQEGTSDSGWQRFVSQLDRLQDPVLKSVFTQAQVISIDETTNGVTIALPEQYSFFNDMIKESMKLWSPLLKEQFGDSASLHFSFSSSKQDVVQEKKTVQNSLVEKTDFQQKEVSAKSAPRTVGAKEKKVDVSDKDRWKKTTMVLNYFPGSVSQLVEQPGSVSQGKNIDEEA